MKEIFCIIVLAICVAGIIEVFGQSIDTYVGWKPFVIAVACIYAIEWVKKIVLDSRSRKEEEDITCDEDCDSCDRNAA